MQRQITALRHLCCNLAPTQQHLFPAPSAPPVLSGALAPALAASALLSPRCITMIRPCHHDPDQALGQQGRQLPAGPTPRGGCRNVAAQRQEGHLGVGGKRQLASETAGAFRCRSCREVASTVQGERLGCHSLSRVMRGPAPAAWAPPRRWPAPPRPPGAPHSPAAAGWWGREGTGGQVGMSAASKTAGSRARPGKRHPLLGTRAMRAALPRRRGPPTPRPRACASHRRVVRSSLRQAVNCGLRSKSGRHWRSASRARGLSLRVGVGVGRPVGRLASWGACKPSRLAASHLGHEWLPAPIACIASGLVCLHSGPPTPAHQERPRPHLRRR